MIRTGLRSLVRRSGFDLVRWPVRHTGYSLDAALQRLFVDRGITHVVDAGPGDEAWGRSVRALGYAGALVSFAPVASSGLAEAARADGRWDVHPVALGASPGTTRLGDARIPVARLDDRLDTVVPRSAVLLLRLATGADLAVLEGAERVLARITAVQTRGPADDERLAWLQARGFALAGLFPSDAGAWETLGVRP